MNKFTLIAVTVLVCLSVYTVLSDTDSSEAASDYSGKCGANATYEFNKSTGVLSIAGSGTMTDYSCTSNVPWNSYKTLIKSVSVGGSVTTIGNYAFSGCSKLTSITISNSVTTLGYSAFSGCSYITSVNIPNSVETIGSSVFSGCTSLTSITIPTSVTTIGSDAFKGCTFLTSITLPSVETIGSSAFSGCIRLTFVEFSSSLTFIDLTAFDDEFYDKDGVTAIPPVASNLAGSTFKKIDDKWVKQPDKGLNTAVYIIVGIIIILGILAFIVHDKKKNGGGSDAGISTGFVTYDKKKNS